MKKLLVTVFVALEIAIGLVLASFGAGADLVFMVLAFLGVPFVFVFGEYATEGSKKSDRKLTRVERRKAA